MSSGFLGSTCAPTLVLVSVGVAFLGAWAVKKEPALVAGQSASGAPSPSAESAAAGKLYGQHCAKCHQADGKGSPQARGLYPEIPDFSDAGWQKRHTDARLMTSILQGKGDGMPGFRDKISKEQAQSLTKHVRKLCGKEKKAEKSFEVHFRSLQEQFETLQRNVEELWRESAHASGPE
jgi:mono/diheme cytochrome c family protein